MSDSVMAQPSSSYSNSIKFYEQMSHLQGELSTYESQQFNLEEEFQRLWTQGTSVPFSNGGVQPKASIYTQLGHLSDKSQLLANPSNTNPQNYGNEDRRRARNQGILDKLQELETNASIFAARSERLRMMRNEYENLVRKYTTNRHRGFTAEGVHNFGSQRFSGETKNKHPIKLTSTSTNTDISGPVIPISSSTPLANLGEKTSFLHIDIPETQVKYPEPIYPQDNSQQCHDHDELISISDRRRYPNIPQILPLQSTSNFPLKNVPSFPDISSEAMSIRKPTFLDISSTTSESADSKLKNRLYHVQDGEADNFDETSPDTTSLSVLLPNSRGSNYILKVSTDGSLSDSTSTNQQQQAHINSRIPTVSSTHLQTKRDRTVGESTASANTNPKARLKGKTVIPGLDERKPVDQQELSYPDTEDESIANNNDSSLHSIGDSMMDSTIYNKTPESLPRDDSELMHISEVDEEYDAPRVDVTHTKTNEETSLLAPAMGTPIHTTRNSNLSSLPGSQIRASPRQITNIESPNEQTQRENASVIHNDKHLERRNNVSSNSNMENNIVLRQLQDLHTGTSSLSRDGELQPKIQFEPLVASSPEVKVLMGSPQNLGREVSVRNDKEMPDRNVENLYEPPEPERGTNKGVADNGDELGEAPMSRISPAKSIMKVEGSTANETTIDAKKATKPSSRKKPRLKMDYDDSESEPSERGNKEEGKQDRLDILEKTPSISASISHNRTPSKEELDAEFADFFD